MFLKNNMKLSILIPCYNWDILHLINDLRALCVKESNLDEFEIICIEDGSSDYFSNHSIKDLKNVKYEILKKNIGRSAIRNLLAKKAQFKWLLFIDCDSKIVTKDFIKNYIKQIDEVKNKIYYGATLYEKKETKSTLHQKYGSKIESKRKKNIFSSHHFLIQKDKFKEHQFDENITSYGYEDVLFQIKHKYFFKHINNPLYHIGLKSNENFIKDCETGLKNLLQYSQDKNVIKKIKLLRWWSRLSCIGLKTLTRILFNIFKKNILENLNSKNPSLFLFQFYKLGFFCELKYNSRKNRK
jgi:glycosyltransferase involved in cell wall biosynthesis